MNIAIAGFGVEGRANLAYWQAKGDTVTVLDESESVQIPEGVASRTGAAAFSQLEDFDMVVRTASLRPDKLASAHKVWSATNEFFAQCPAPVVGVTGTKGKGTTSTLIANILQQAGKTVHLVGNIGVPALDVLPRIQPNDVVVFELSSFQLWDLEKSPHTAVVLMIEPDHQDVHRDMKEYVSAKANIRRHQVVGDTCFYHPTNMLSKQVAETSEISQPRRFGVPEEGACYVKENTFFVQNDPICSVDTLQVVGQHNVENACAAISAAWEYTHSKDAVTEALQAFTGLPHRLKFVRELGGVAYYDDSIATTPGSAIAALDSFRQPKVIILGGSDKRASYDELVQKCRATAARVVTMGQTGSAIAELCRQQGVPVVETGEQGMSATVAAAANWAQPGDVVILSPASASFGMFANYTDRGEQFVAAVEALGE